MLTTKQLRGRFIVFEGVDGSGKTTQMRLFKEALGDLRDLHISEFRDPGGTPVGEEIRDILLSPGRSIDPHTEFMLYMASRACLVNTVIGPCLRAGHLALGDRFTPSTFAYQAYAGRLPFGTFDAVASAVCGRYTPDLVVIYLTSADNAANRLSPILDRMEAKGVDFHNRVATGYRIYAERYPLNTVIIDSSGTIEETHALTLDVVSRFFAE